MDYLQRSTALADMVPAAWRELPARWPAACERAPAEAPRGAALGRRRRGADRQRCVLGQRHRPSRVVLLGGCLGHLLPQTQLGPLFDEIIKGDLVTVDFTAAGATALACLALDHGSAQPDAVRLTVEGDLADEPIPE